MHHIYFLFPLADYSVTIGLSASCLFCLLLQAGYTIVIAVAFQNKKLLKIKNVFSGKDHILKKVYYLIYQHIWLEIVTFLLSVVFVIASIVLSVNGDCHSKALWRVGIFAVMFGWTNFILMASKFPVIGEYALMFKTIFKSFLKLALFGILLVLASVIVLDMIFYDPLAPVSFEITFLLSGSF